MVCLSEENVIQVTVKDLWCNQGKTLKLRLSPDKSVESIFTEVVDHYNYDINAFELVLQNNRNGDYIVLNDHRDGTLQDAHVNFDPDIRSTIIINEKKTNHKILSLPSTEDDLLLGASASPTASDDPNVEGMSVDYYSTKGPLLQGCSRDNPFDGPNYVGLVNQAMTCYLNSLLQALYMTPEFRNALYNWEFDGNNPDTSIPFQLQRLFLNLQTSKKSSVETTDLTHSFGWNTQQAWEQHDIQELCRVMFDALEQKFKDTKQANLINNLYEGKMLDYVKCLECNTEKSREDTFQDIPLPVRPFGSTIAYNSVEEALHAFVQPETLDENNQYHCEKCNKKCDAHKGLKFTKFPYLLTLHLKRFDFDYSTMNRIKLNDKVVFPNILNLNSFIPNASVLSDDAMEEREISVNKCDDCSTTDSGSALDDESCQGTDVSSSVNGPDDNCQDDDEGIDVSSGPNNHHENEKNRLHEPKGPYIYELFSIMIHSGSASGGHYYAYIKDFSKNKWFCFNDQSVSQVTEVDIQKTYGGGQRGYYSGAYTSSTNAYMLMYRQIDKDRNCLAYTNDELPPHIKTLLVNMREQEETDRRNREKENCAQKIKLYCLHPTLKHITQYRLFIFSDTTLESATSEGYAKFKLQDIVRLEDCRLVAYSKCFNVIMCSFDNPDLQLGEIYHNHTEFFLEIKAPEESFEKYALGGVMMRAYLMDLQAEDVTGPVNVWIDQKDKVADLKQKLAKRFNVDAVYVVQQVNNNPPQYLIDESAHVKFDANCNAYKLFASKALDGADQDPNYVVSKLSAEIERFASLISLDLAVQEAQRETLEELSIPPLDLNQNLDRIEIGAGDRTSNSSSLRVSPQPVPEMFGDQSNSEDSSLSDSDRTLVGDAPDDFGLLTCSSNSPADQHMASPVEPPEDYVDAGTFRNHEEMNWDSEESPAAIDKPTNQSYFFKVEFSGQAPEFKIYRVLADRHMTLARLKKKLESIVGVSTEYFKVFYQSTGKDVEWTILDETLATFKDDDKLTIKLGRVLKQDEVSCKVYHFIPENAEPMKYLFERVIAKGQTVEAVKRDILLQAKKMYMIDIPFARCRLRRKFNKNPAVVYMDNERFGDDIYLASTFELLLQDSPGTRKMTEQQTFVFVRQWHPSSLTLAEYQELCLEDKSLQEIKTAIANVSKIPSEFLEIAAPKCYSFPCGMSMLDINDKLEWSKNPDDANIGMCDEGCMFFYRDSREQLKELTLEEKKDLEQSENKRLGRMTAKGFSPRRKERGLKIYVDTSPKKEDED